MPILPGAIHCVHAHRIGFACLLYSGNIGDFSDNMSADRVRIAIERVQASNAGPDQALSVHEYLGEQVR